MSDNDQVSSTRLSEAESDESETERKPKPVDTSNRNFSSSGYSDVLASVLSGTLGFGSAREVFQSRLSEHKATKKDSSSSSSSSSDSSSSSSAKKAPKKRKGKGKGKGNKATETSEDDTTRTDSSSSRVKRKSKGSDSETSTTTRDSEKSDKPKPKPKTTVSERLSEIRARLRDQRTQGPNTSVNLDTSQSEIAEPIPTPTPKEKETVSIPLPITNEKNVTTEIKESKDLAPTPNDTKTIPIKSTPKSKPQSKPAASVELPRQKEAPKAKPNPPVKVNRSSPDPPKLKVSEPITEEPEPPKPIPKTSKPKPQHTDSNEPPQRDIHTPTPNATTGPRRSSIGKRPASTSNVNSLKPQTTTRKLSSASTDSTLTLDSDGNNAEVETKVIPTRHPLLNPTPPTVDATPSPRPPPQTHSAPEVTSPLNPFGNHSSITRTTVTAVQAKPPPSTNSSPVSLPPHSTKDASSDDDVGIAPQPASWSTSPSSVDTEASSIIRNYVERKREEQKVLANTSPVNLLPPHSLSNTQSSPTKVRWTDDSTSTIHSHNSSVSHSPVHRVPLNVNTSVHTLVSASCSTIPAVSSSPLRKDHKPLHTSILDSSELVEVDGELNQLRYESEFYENGDSYMGYMLNDMKHGRGVYLFSNGSQYKGNWSLGKMHGWGVFIEHSTGDRFEGEWVEGERSFGIYYYSNKDMYHGGFLHNKKHGRGVVWENRVMFEVFYEHDICVDKHPWTSNTQHNKHIMENGKHHKDLERLVSQNGQLQKKNVALEDRISKLKQQLSQYQEQIKSLKDRDNRKSMSPPLIENLNRQPNSHNQANNHRRKSDPSQSIRHNPNSVVASGTELIPPHYTHLSQGFHYPSPSPSRMSAQPISAWENDNTGPNMSPCSSDEPEYSPFAHNTNTPPAHMNTSSSLVLSNIASPIHSHPSTINSLDASVPLPPSNLLPNSGFVAGRNSPTPVPSDTNPTPITNISTSQASSPSPSNKGRFRLRKARRVIPSYANPTVTSFNYASSNVSRTAERGSSIEIRSPPRARTTTPVKSRTSPAATRPSTPLSTRAGLGSSVTKSQCYPVSNHTNTNANGSPASSNPPSSANTVSSNGMSDTPLGSACDGPRHVPHPQLAELVNGDGPHTWISVSAGLFSPVRTIDERGKKHHVGNKFQQVDITTNTRAMNEMYRYFN